MKLVVGLGNPGKEYAVSRHNIGFRCLDQFAREHSIEVGRKKAKALVGDGRVGSEKVILAKPQTFMNNSGESVVMLLQQNGVEPADMVVVYDDMDLPLGRVRVRPGGGAGGHHGIESIISLTGTAEFTRVRVGIGRPGPAGEQRDAVGYVLGRFHPDEEKDIEDAVVRVSQILKTIILKGVDRAMNEFNREPVDKPVGPEKRTPGKNPVIEE